MRTANGNVGTGTEGVTVTVAELLLGTGSVPLAVTVAVFDIALDPATVA
jgi:hypothetical protein